MTRPGHGILPFLSGYGSVWDKNGYTCQDVPGWIFRHVEPVAGLRAALPLEIQEH